MKSTCTPTIAGLCLLGASLLGIRSNAQTLIANYPLTTNSNDASGQLGPITYGPFASPPPTAACASGQYPDGGFATPDFAPLLDRTNFAVEMDFTLQAYLPGFQPRPFFILDQNFRTFGLVVDENGLVGVYYNNGEVIYSTEVISLNQPYHVMVKFVGTRAEIVLNNRLILSRSLPPLEFAPAGWQTQLGTINYGNGTNFQGCMNNLRIYSGGVALPIKLEYFRAGRQSDEAVLSWAGATTDGTERFEVERSADGRNWSAIGAVAAVMHSSAAVSYHFQDARPLAGRMNYYRLRQVGAGGRSTLSETRQLDFSGTGSISIYPNPATDKLTVDLRGTAQTNCLVRLFNAVGQEVLRETAAGGTASLSVAQLPGGTYLLRIQDGANVVGNERVSIVR